MHVTLEVRGVTLNQVRSPFKIYKKYTDNSWKKMLKLEMCFFFSESGFQCLQLEKVSENVVRLQVGRLTHTKDEACHPQLFFNNIHPILLTSKLV